MDVDQEAWLATLEYWLACGIQYRSGDNLEFHVNPFRALDKLHVIPSSSIQTATTSASPIGRRNVLEGAGKLPPQKAAQNWPTPRPRQPMSVDPIPLPPKVETTMERTKRTPSEARSLARIPLAPMIPPAERPALFETMARDLASCKKCILAKTRTKTVFGVGTTNSPVVFVGEGPGADEDRQGEPFVGASGKLLDQMLRAIALDRSRVFIANVVKCRPPGNRNPSTDEIEACQGYLFRQLEIVRPKVIFCLGKFSFSCLTNYSGTIGTARGKEYSWHGIPVIASYHPAYYLRSPRRKSAAWEDLIRLTKLLEQS